MASAPSEGAVVKVARQGTDKPINIYLHDDAEDTEGTYIGVIFDGPERAAWVVEAINEKLSRDGCDCCGVTYSPQEMQRLKDRVTQARRERKEAGGGA